jgi:hypothetical protein
MDQKVFVAIAIAIKATVTDQGGGIGMVEWPVNGVTLGVESRGFGRIDSGSAKLSLGRFAPKLWLSVVTIMQRNKSLAVVDKTLAG